MVKVLKQKPVPSDELLAALDRVEQQLSVRLKSAAVSERLEPNERRELILLARKGGERDTTEDKRLRALVEQAAPGLLARLQQAKDEQVRRVRERQADAQGEPKRVLLPEGAACLPAGVLDDLLEGRLHAVDLALLAVFALTFTTGRVSDYVAGAGSARFVDDGTLIVRDLGRGLLADWGELAPRFVGIFERLAGREWLAVVKEGREVRVRPGRRLTEAWTT